MSTKTLDIKLIDFGTMTEYHPGEMETKFVGTLKYASPDIVNACHHNHGYIYQIEAQEVYALGMILYNLVSKDKFSNPKSVQNTLKNMTLLKSGTDVLANLLHALLNEDWKKRPMLDLILDHPYFSTGHVAIS